MMDTNKSAADWADSHWSPLTGEDTELTSFNVWHHRRFGFVDHRNVTCASRWAIWQASREAVVVELPRITGHEYVPLAGADYREGCREAIEAQNLKVKP